jgi:hypothetical protein
MDETPLPAAPSAPPSETGRRLREGWRDGLRAAFFLRPRAAAFDTTPAALLVTLALVTAVELVLARLEVPGRAVFDVRGWLIPWWSVAASVLLVWVLLWPRHGQAPARGGTAAFVLLWWVASLPLLLVNEVLAIAQAREALPAALDASLVFAWGVFLGLQAWSLAVPVFLGAVFGLRAARLAVLGLGVAALHAVGVWHFQDRPWEPVAQVSDERPRLELSQETFEVQQALWERTVAALAPQREGRVDVWGIVFSPYAGEDVFLRENHLVADLLRERFDAPQRVLQLANHASTATTLPWATPRNLERAIQAVAQRMDRDEDVLVLYLTSHGADDFRLAADHWPLQVPPLDPGALRRALDEAGIRHRVIAISACYSGGWVGPLAGDDTLVMTAADADHTSYGCGRRSELTFFGRAVFGEQLRRTRSFEEAFAAAVPVIKRREEEAGKPDGFSNPQISVGARIRPVLRELAAELDQGGR